MMIQKALVSRYFNEPISTIDSKFSLYELEKWSTMAYWIASEIDLAPYKTKK